MKAALKMAFWFWLIVMVPFLIIGAFGFYKDYQAQRDVEARLAKDFKKLGYKGKLTVTKYEKTAGYGEDMTYQYEEEVDGQQLTFSATVDYDPSTKEYDSRNSTPVLEETGTDLDDVIQLEAMWKQPYVQKQFRKMEASLKKIEDEDLVLEKVYGQTGQAYHDEGPQASEMRNAAQDDLVKLFQKNRQEGLPLRGYYKIPVQTYLKNQALQIRINYHYRVGSSFNQLKDEESYTKKFFEKAEKLDYSDFWDGYYLIGYSFKTPSGSSSGDVRVAYIRNGKLVRFLDI